MGLSTSKPYCGCCPCCCRQETVDGLTRMSPMGDGKDETKWYRPHTLDAESMVRVDDRLKVGANPGFIDDPEAPTGSGGPKPEPPNDRSGTQVTTPVNTEAQAKRRSERVEGLQNKVSIHNYKQRSADDLEVQKGDKLEVLSEHGPWIIAKTLSTDSEPKTGYIPRTFLANAGSLEAEEP